MKSQSVSSGTASNNDGAGSSSNAQPTSSIKKSSSSFFEKHAFLGSGNNASGSGGPTHHNFMSHSNAVAKMPSNSSSSYNMHRQNATRGDMGSQSSLQRQLGGNSSVGSSSNQHSHHHHVSRDKPSSKQFSQNMLSKSQHFASL